ncbi:MAG: hypothetical protein AAF360_00540, partial [Pseudomonadota bacterium]
MRGGVFGAACALSLAACAGPPPQAGSNAPAGASSSSSPSAGVAEPRKVDAKGQVTVALLAPTTAASEGARRAAQDLVAAAQMAKKERGPKNLALKVYDTKGTAAGASAAASRAAAEGAALIIGPMLAGSAQAAGPVAAKANLNMLAFSNDDSVAGGNVWVLGQTPGGELRRLLSYSAARGVSSIAVAYPTNRYGELIASEAPSAASDAGVGVGPFVAYERSFKGIEAASKAGATAIRGQGVSGVLIADRGDALRSMGAFLSYYDVRPGTVRYLGLSRW